MLDFRLELVKMLVRQDQPDAVLSQLGDHVRHAERREILELVDVEKEISAIALGHVCAAEGGKADRGHQEATEQGRAVLANLSASKIDQEHLAAVHHSTEMERALRFR